MTALFKSQIETEGYRGATTIETSRSTGELHFKANHEWCFLKEGEDKNRPYTYSLVLGVELLTKLNATAYSDSVEDCFMKQHLCLLFEEQQAQMQQLKTPWMRQTGRIEIIPNVMYHGDEGRETFKKQFIRAFEAAGWFESPHDRSRFTWEWDNRPGFRERLVGTLVPQLDFSEMKLVAQYVEENPDKKWAYRGTISYRVSGLADVTVRFTREGVFTRGADVLSIHSEPDKFWLKLELPHMQDLPMTDGFFRSLMAEIAVTALHVADFSQSGYMHQNLDDLPVSHISYLASTPEQYQLLSENLRDLESHSGHQDTMGRHLFNPQVTNPIVEVISVKPGT